MKMLMNSNLVDGGMLVLAERKINDEVGLMFVDELCGSISNVRLDHHHLTSWSSRVLRKEEEATSMWYLLGVDSRNVKEANAWQVKKIQIKSWLRQTCHMSRFAVCISFAKEIQINAALEQRKDSLIKSKRNQIKRSVSIWKNHHHQAQATS